MKIFTPVNYNHILYLDVRWYNNCGILLVFDAVTKEYKSYISGENVNSGSSINEDIEKIAAHGNTFPLEAAHGIFKFDENEDLIIIHAEHFI